MFTNLPLDTGLVFLGGYLLGSIPFGLILTRLAGLGDIRTIGSGNIGATNVLRTGKKTLAALTVLLDGGKGVAAVLLAMAFASMIAAQNTASDRPFLLLLWPSVAGLAAVLGHMFPIWLRFKGGKGVATAFGVFTAFAWPIGVVGMATWLAVAVISRISSLAALIAMAAAPIYACVWGRPGQATVVLLIAVLVIAKHHANIRRLIKGEEPRIGSSA